MAETTPGIAFTAASAALRTGSHACTAAASTVIEKNTLPSDHNNIGKRLGLRKRIPVRAPHLLQCIQNVALAYRMTALRQPAGNRAEAKSLVRNTRADRADGQ